MLSQSKSRQIWKTALLPIIDFFALVFGAGIVYLIRYRWYEDNLFGFTFGSKQITGREYLDGAIVISLIVVLIYAFMGLYELNRRRNVWKLVVDLALGIFVALLCLITYFFFNEYDREALPQGVPISRFIMATGGFVALYFVLVGRAIVWLGEQTLFRFGVGKINVAIIGDSDGHLNRHLSRRQDINQIYDYFELTKENFEFLEVLIKKGDLSEIYLIGKQSALEAELAGLAELYKVSFIFSPLGLGQYQAFGFKPLTIGQKVYLELQHSNLDGWLIVVKRVFDIVFASLFMLLFSWLYILIAIMIKLDSPGSVFYLSERVGPNGKVFKLWKFRRFKQEFCTSEKNAEALAIEKELIEKQNMREGGILYKIKDDPRMTRVGRILEKTSLDELPQFINVLLGNMSVVGPRPHQPREVAKYAKHHYKVLNIKPGITGMAQIKGRSDLSFEEEVSYDTYYVEHWSFWMDLTIIINTPLVIIFKRHKA